ncbi:MAG: PfkB family carbohydrate kinase [Chloroflexota bacterium]|nr:PfkB family carbohydrate kinase [Chloroflexota bacterium]
MSIVSFGELLIDFVALETGVTVGDASGFVKAPGGAPANVAVAVARLGVASAFIGMVGDDPFGHHLAGVLQVDGVDRRGLRFHPTARTALAFVSLAADGDRSFSFYRNPSADMLMQPSDVALDVLEGQRILHFGSITLIHEPSRSATLAAVEHARARGLLISYDPNLRLALWDSPDAARAGMLLGMGYAHVVKISQEELEFLTGAHDLNSLWRAYPHLRLIAVTRGAGGATLYTPTGTHDAPAFAVNAVDTTGAGDGFVAGMLVQMVERGNADPDFDYTRHLGDIVRFANAVGALATTQKGGIPGLPTRTAVEDFLKANG